MAATRRNLIWLAWGCWLATAAFGEAIGPQPDSAGVRTAREALALAKEIVATAKNVPATADWEIGYLEAWLGELPQGLATIAAVDDPDVAGRHDAFYHVGHDLAARGDVDHVIAAGATVHGSDRAWLLAGVAKAQFERGDSLAALANLMQTAESEPAVAARFMLDEADRLRGLGQPVPIELYSRCLDAVRQIPNEQVDADGTETQATAALRLAELHAADGNDDAALQAAEAASDPVHRQVPLLQLATRQAAAGRFGPAVDTAAKLSVEIPEPGSGASYRVTALSRIVAAQHHVGDRENRGAPATAQLAAEAAQRTVDNSVRTLSLLLAAGNWVTVGQPDRTMTLVSGALSGLHVTDQTRRAQVLLRTACVQAAARQADLAKASFKSGREVAQLAGTPEALDAAIAWPAELGLLDEANAGLALRQDPASARAGRLLLVRSLANAGLLDSALAATEPFPLGVAEDRQAYLAALLAVAPTAPAPRQSEILQRALGVAKTPFDLEGLAQVATTAGQLGLPEVALDTWSAAQAGATEINLAETRLGLDRFLNAVGTALRQLAAGGADAGQLASRAETAAMQTRDAVARAAALTVIGQTVTELGAREPGGRLLDRAAAEARVVEPGERQVRALAEEAAVAARLGFASRAQASFEAAEAICDQLDAVPPELLLTLAETEVEAGRRGTERWLLRSVLTLPNFEREGSTDLLRLARIAAYVGLPSDSLAIARRVYRPAERLQAYLGLARVNLDRPVRPLRARDWYPLPEWITPGNPG